MPLHKIRLDNVYILKDKGLMGGPDNNSTLYDLEMSWAYVSKVVKISTQNQPLNSHSHPTEAQKVPMEKVFYGKIASCCIARFGSSASTKRFKCLVHYVDGISKVKSRVLVTTIKSRFLAVNNSRYRYSYPE